MRTSDYVMTTAGNVAFDGLPYTPSEVRQHARWLLKVADSAEQIKRLEAARQFFGQPATGCDPATTRESDKDNPQGQYFRADGSGDNADVLAGLVCVQTFAEAAEAIRTTTTDPEYIEGLAHPYRPEELDTLTADQWQEVASGWDCNLPTSGERFVFDGHVIFYV